MKVARLSALRIDRPYPQEIFLVLIYVRGWVEPRTIVRPKGLCQWKIPMTTSGTKPATFRLVAQYFDQQGYRVPLYKSNSMLIKQQNRQHENVKHVTFICFKRQFVLVTPYLTYLQLSAPYLNLNFSNCFRFARAFNTSENSKIQQHCSKELKPRLL
jgi:hypothetical protein